MVSARYVSVAKESWLMVCNTVLQLNCIVCVHAVGLLHSVVSVASIMSTNNPFSVIVFFMFVMFWVWEIKLLLLSKFHMCCIPVSTSSIKAVAQ
jgi:hypothetical protein